MPEVAEKSEDNFLGSGGWGEYKEETKVVLWLQCFGLSLGLIAAVLAFVLGWDFVATVCIVIVVGNVGVFLVAALALIRAWMELRLSQRKSRRAKYYG